LIEGAVGAIFAGGRSKRFGSEKAVAPIGGRPLIERAVAHLAPYAAEIAVNAPVDSGAAAWARAAGCALAPDAPGDPQGPLAGLKAALVWAVARNAQILLTAPCDTPLLPGDAYRRLAAELGAGSAAVAEAADGLHPLCGVWRPQALGAVTEALAGGAHPPVRSLLTALDAVCVRFDDVAAFANINTPDDLTWAAARLPGAR
jgi:molybdopterin-guanine dinucleotide biosynthesis protein A